MRVAKTPFERGIENEKTLRARLLTLRYNGNPFPVSDVAGANRKAPDLTLQLNEPVTLETKRPTASEGGGSVMRYRDGQLQLPENEILRKYFPPDFHLWDGRIPSCLRGDRSAETWLTEKKTFPGCYIPVDSGAVAEYYRTKGTMYIQIERQGLYHTGIDPCGWGVPKFDLPCRIRIRLKQHHSTSVPQDVQACFNYNLRHLAKSPYDFTDDQRLPPGFTLAAE